MFTITKETVLKYGMKEEFPEVFKLPYGEWLKDDVNPKWLGLQVDEENLFGINYLGDWFLTQKSRGQTKDLTNRLATKEEIETALFAEAKKRGFKEGVTVVRTQEMLDLYKSSSSDCVVKIDSDYLAYDLVYKSVQISGRVIMIGGIWATIQEEEEIWTAQPEFQQLFTSNLGNKEFRKV